MSNFKPKWPLTVAGQDYRLPFDHPEIEAVGARMQRLYTLALTNAERGYLIKAHRWLAECDRTLVTLLGDAVLPYSGERPLLPTVYGTVLTPRDNAMSPPAIIGRNVGYLRRVEGYVADLGKKYHSSRPADCSGEPMPADGRSYSTTDYDDNDPI